MLDLIKAGGWLMLPIIACSVVALTIIGERMWALRRANALPRELVEALRNAAKGQEMLEDALRGLGLKSPLGRIVTAALSNRSRGREVVKETIEDTGRHVTHELERYLNALGTIAAITPLLGLLGTVFGMIEVFTVITVEQRTDTKLLAGGISTALVTTAAGLTVAIPALLFYRYFRGKVETLVVGMEQEAMRLMKTIDSTL